MDLVELSSHKCLSSGLAAPGFFISVNFFYNFEVGNIESAVALSLELQACRKKASLLLLYWLLCCFFPLFPEP